VSFVEWVEWVESVAESVAEDDGLATDGFGHARVFAF